jgi:hypothetical protein
LVNIVPYRKEKIMNRDLGISAESPDHPAETKNPATQNVHRDKRQRNEDAERARSVIESLLHAEPLEDAAEVWQYSAIKAEQAVAREEYREAARLYEKAWRSLSKKDRDRLRMQRILSPLVSLYSTQQRHAEATALQLQINEACRQLSGQGIEILDKHLTAEWLDGLLVAHNSLLKFLRQCEPIATAFLDYYDVYENEGENKRAEGLRQLCAEMNSYANEVRISCHVLKSREHALKAFLIETEGIKAERNEEAAELVRARARAQDELQYCAHDLGRLTYRLVEISNLVRLLKRDLPGLSQVDRAKLEQYEEICQYLTLKEEEEWERFPIVELLDIAAAYLVNKEGL